MLGSIILVFFSAEFSRRFAQTKGFWLFGEVKRFIAQPHTHADEIYWCVSQKQ